QGPEAFWYSVNHFPLLSVGLNCALGPAEMRPFVSELHGLADCYVSCHPNAGLPNAMGGFDLTPEATANYLLEFAKEGWLNFAGGCCGTTPEHIEAIAKALKGVAPRVPVTPEPFTRLSGLDPLVIRPETNFINVGERTN